MKKLYFGGSILTIDRDPLSVPENELRNIKVLSTIKEDRVLFHAYKNSCRFASAGSFL